MVELQLPKLLTWVRFPSPAPPTPPRPYTLRMEPRDPAAAGDFRELDGDDSLIRWMMSLSPAERLQVLQGFVDSIGEFVRDQSTAIQRRP